MWALWKVLFWFLAVESVKQHDLASSYRRGWGRILLAKYAKHLCDLLQQRCEIQPTQSGLRRTLGLGKRRALNGKWRVEKPWTPKEMPCLPPAWGQPVVVIDLPLDWTPGTVLCEIQWNGEIWQKMKVSLRSCFRRAPAVFCGTQSAIGTSWCG